MWDYDVHFRVVQPPRQMLAQELPDSRPGEQPGPSGRKRQPSMSETMPLYTLCKEDLESMDKEVRPAGASAPGAGRGPRSRTTLGFPGTLPPRDVRRP